MEKTKQLLEDIQDLIETTNWDTIQREVSMEKQIEIRAELKRAERRLCKALKIEVPR